MGSDVRQAKQQALRRINPTGQEHAYYLTNLGAEYLGMLVHSNGMQVHNAENVIELCLSSHPVTNSTNIVAKVQIPRGLDARKDNRLGMRHDTSSACCGGPTEIDRRHVPPAYRPCKGVDRHASTILTGNLSRFLQDARKKPRVEFRVLD